jgi:signal transduction histidine kinase
MLRLCAIASGLLLMAVGLGAPWPVASLLAGGALCAVLVERYAMWRQASSGFRVSLRSLQAEGQRDALAQVMSLELAHERKHTVLEALREGVLVVDDSGEIVLANAAVRRAMQQPEQDPTGRLLWDVLVPELAQRARQAWLALRERGAAAEPPQVRASAIACGNLVYDLTAVEATSRRTGQSFGSVFLLVDSTRAHELQRLKDRFLSSVSHELRTPLTNVCAYAEILRHMLPSDSAEWPEFVRVIHEESVQLSRLLDGMFDYLQLESGDALFGQEVFDGGRLVRTTVAAFEALAATRRIRIDLDIAIELPRLQGDARRLEQVVKNLVDNAVKFSPDGGAVRVAVASSDGQFELRIDDSGPGVPLADRDAVFEKFHQLRDHLTEKPSGTGLGLATSRAIVHRFSGRIWCEDSPFGGASFVVSLPAGKPSAATRPDTVVAAVGAGT